MNMMKLPKRLVIFAAAAISAWTLTGCGDGSVDDKPPPLEGLRLVTRMLTSLQEHDFATATRQYHKLTAGAAGQLDVASILFEQTIESNRVAIAVAEKLDAGDVAGAVFVARDAKRLNPLNQGIEETFAAVNSLQELSNCAHEVRTASNSIQLSAALSRLYAAIREDPDAAPLKRLAEVGMARLDNMRRVEDRRARFGLLADYHAAKVSGAGAAGAIQAEYELEYRRTRKNPLPLIGVQDELYPKE